MISGAINPDLICPNSKIRGAIPILPIYAAAFCFFCNVFVPGSGTILSGFLCLCCGRTRFGETCTFDDRFGALLLNIIIGISQFCTIVFCLVGWCWSVGWGLTMISIAKNNAVYVIKNDEESSIDPETNIVPRSRRSASAKI